MPRNLRSGGLYWPTTRTRPVFGRGLRGCLRVDVMVVGAGITGALVADELAAAGARVAVLDRRRPASGSTPASSALLLYEFDTPLRELARRVGSAHAQKAYAASYRSVRDMELLGRELGEEVSMIRRPSLYLAVSARDLRAMRAEVSARRAIGIAATLLSREELGSRFGIDRPGAIHGERALEVNPLALTYALLERAQRGSAAVLACSGVDPSCVAGTARPFRARPSPGLEVVADHIVVATGYETPDQFAALRRLTKLRASFVVATAPVPQEPWGERALLWDAGDPYLYARTTSDGRVLIGGGDVPYTSPDRRDRLIPAKSRALLSELHSLSPRLSFRPAYRWAGTFAQTRDGLPFIDEHRRWPGVHFALGYGGNGITFSLIAARIIAARIQGKTHPASGLFRFSR